MTNRYFLLILHISSLFLLGFGWFLDMLKIDISAHFIMEISLFNETRSIVGSLQSLLQSHNYLPFTLIFLFGIIVPLVKSGAIFYLLLSKKPSLQWHKFVAAISKWAMADVFAISIFVAFLGARAMQNTTAELLTGFYCFTGYVLLSAIIAVFSGKMIKQNQLQAINKETN